MRIEIEIPKEFEEHFNQDKFKDSFERIMADIRHSLENGDCLCAGRYEHETIEMLQKAFENSRQSYSVAKVVEELEELRDRYDDGIKNFAIRGIIEKAIEIVKQGGVSDDACEWKYNDTEYYWESSCEHLHIFMSDGPKQNEYSFCPYCGKKIKVVE